MNEFLIFSEGNIYTHTMFTFRAVSVKELDTNLKNGSDVTKRSQLALV